MAIVQFFDDLLKTRSRFYLALAVAVGVLWILIAINLFSTLKTYSIRRHYTAAYRYYHRGGIVRTQEELNEVVRLEPRFAKAYTLAGMIAVESKSYNDAARYFSRTLDIAGPSAELLNGLGITRILSRHRQGQPVDLAGLAHLKRAATECAAERPGDVYVNLGNLALYEGLLAGKNDPAAAESHFSDAANYFNEALATGNVRYDGLVNLYAGRGVLFAARAAHQPKGSRKRTLQLARKEMQKALLFDPKSPELAINDTLLALEAADDLPLNHPERKGLYEQALALTKRNPHKLLSCVVQNNLGLIEFAEKRYGKVAELLDAAAADYPASYLPIYNKAAALVEIARQRPDSKTLVNARPAVKKAIEYRSLPDRERFLLSVSLAALEYRGRQFDNARKLYETAARVADAVPKAQAATAYHGLAVIYYEQGEFRRAIEMIEKTLEADPAADELRLLTSSLAQPPYVSKPAISRMPDLPPNMQPIFATVFNRSTGELLQKEHILATIDDRLINFEFAAASQIMQIIMMPAEPLADGHHTVRVEAVDHFGNRAQAETVFTVDTLPPEASDFHPVRSAVLTAGESPVFSLTLRDELSQVDYGSIRLLVKFEPAEGSDARPTSYSIITDGKYDYTNETAPPGSGVITGTFRYMLKEALLPGVYRLTLGAADTAENSAQWQWSYNVIEEADEL